jgi:hypothetical protein
MMREKSYPENIINTQINISCANYTKKDKILGNEAGGPLFNATDIVTRFWTPFTTFLVPAEYDLI